MKHMKYMTVGIAAAVLMLLAAAGFFWLSVNHPLTVVGITIGPIMLFAVYMLGKTLCERAGSNT